MKKKMLTCALLGAVAFANTAMAQEFDDRWYVSGGGTFNAQDERRTTDDDFGYYIGLGKFVSPNWSLDVELNHTNTVLLGNRNLNWSQYGISTDARYHFIKEGRNWWPFVRMGVGLQRANEEFNAFPSPASPGESKRNNLAANLGLGLQADYGRVDLRAEIFGRADFDDTSVAASSESRFLDVVAALGVTVALGPEAAAPVVEQPVAPPAPAAPSCETLDSDGDGVNNCNDRCPNSVAGQTIGPDGCAVVIQIDLKGVNFDFDSANLRADSNAVLAEAIEILRRYPTLKGEVAGHTDSVGSDDYNQRLSERRARTVYDYLVANGIAADRLVGPVGYGEARPLDTNDTAAGRERNRRTELNVQN